MTKQVAIIRPLAGYGLIPPRGNFVDHIFLEAQCLARILQHVSPLTMAACYIRYPTKYLISKFFKTSEKCIRKGKITKLVTYSE